VLLLNHKNTQSTRFVHIFITIADSLSNCLFLTAYKNVRNVGLQTWAQLGDTFSIR